MITVRYVGKSGSETTARVPRELLELVSAMTAQDEAEALAWLKAAAENIARDPRRQGTVTSELERHVFRATAKALRKAHNNRLLVCSLPGLAACNDITDG